LCEAIRKVLEKAFFMVGIVPIEKIWDDWLLILDLSDEFMKIFIENSVNQ
jgi:hypothetical protein